MLTSCLKHVLYLLWLALFAASVASLALNPISLPAAEAILKAPAQFSACQLVTLEAAGTKADAIEWTCSDNDVRCWYSSDRLSTVVWVPTPRRTVFILKASDKAGEKVAFVVCHVTGPGPQPNPQPGPLPAPGPAPWPNPQPQPNPAPSPDIKPGRFNIAATVHTETLKISQPYRSQSSVVCESIKTVRSQIVAGAIDTSRPANVFTALRGEYGRNLKADSRKAWSDWGTVWGNQVKVLYDAGKLKTQEDWRDLLDETCVGLGGV